MSAGILVVVRLLDLDEGVLVAEQSVMVNPEGPALASMQLGALRGGLYRLDVAAPAVPVTSAPTAADIVDEIARRLQEPEHWSEEG